MLPSPVFRFTIMTMSTRLLVVCLLGLSLLSCRGTRDTRVNPDAPDTVTGTGLQSQDIRTIAQQMAADIKATGVLAPGKEGERASFFIAPLVNESSDTINTALIPTTIRTEIARAFGRTVRIIDRAPEANDLVDAERRMKDRGQVSGTNDRKVAGSDYVLKGRMQSRDRQAGRLKSSFIVVTLEITDLVTSELVWTNDYQMKTESEKSVINR
jgi:PBP1b-binding outer membrane lipoprotein LpoB